MGNYYEVLEITKDATEEEIKNAYRRLAKVHHPDLGGDNDKMQQINGAYFVLSDKVRRSEYDTAQSNQEFNDILVEKLLKNFRGLFINKVNLSFVNNKLFMKELESIISEIINNNVLKQYEQIQLRDAFLSFGNAGVCYFIAEMEELPWEEVTNNIFAIGNILYNKNTKIQPSFNFNKTANLIIDELATHFGDILNIRYNYSGVFFHFFMRGYYFGAKDKINWDNFFPIFFFLKKNWQILFKIITQPRRIFLVKWNHK